MNHVRLETQDRGIRDFVLGLTEDRKGAVLELNGKAVARVVPMPAGKGQDGSEWTDEKNVRRCDLIDRKYDGTLTAEEAVELADLQDQMIRYRQRVAPLPLEHARRLHQELLHQAEMANNQGIDS